MEGWMGEHLQEDRFLSKCKAQIDNRWDKISSNQMRRDLSNSNRKDNNSNRVKMGRMEVNKETMDSNLLPMEMAHKWWVPRMETKEIFLLKIDLFKVRCKEVVLLPGEGMKVQEIWKKLQVGEENLNKFVVILHLKSHSLNKVKMGKMGNRVNKMETNSKPLEEQEGFRHRIMRS